jgi:hypothetical protein
MWKGSPPSLPFRPSRTTSHLSLDISGFVVEEDGAIAALLDAFQENPPAFPVHRIEV